MAAMASPIACPALANTSRAATSPAWAASMAASMVSDASPVASRTAATMGAVHGDRLDAAASPAVAARAPRRRPGRARSPRRRRATPATIRPFTTSPQPIPTPTVTSANDDAPMPSPNHCSATVRDLTSFSSVTRRPVAVGGQLGQRHLPPVEEGGVAHHAVRLVHVARHGQAQRVAALPVGRVGGEQLGDEVGQRRHHVLGRGGRQRAVRGDEHLGAQVGDDTDEFVVGDLHAGEELPVRLDGQRAGRTARAGPRPVGGLQLFQIARLDERARRLGDGGGRQPRPPGDLHPGDRPLRQDHGEHGGRRGSGERCRHDRHRNTN